MLNKFITEHEFFNIKQSDNLEENIKKFLQISSSSDYVYGSSSDYVYGSSSDYGIKNFNGKTMKKIHEENNNGGQENE